jgi:hypothetical protein
MKGIYDMDEGDKPSNKLANGICFRDDNCRKSMVVYNLHCEISDKRQTTSVKLRTTSKSEPVNTFTTYGR